MYASNCKYYVERSGAGCSSLSLLGVICKLFLSLMPYSSTLEPALAPRLTEGYYFNVEINQQYSNNLNELVTVMKW